MAVPNYINPKSVTEKQLVEKDRTIRNLLGEIEKLEKELDEMTKIGEAAWSERDKAVAENKRLAAKNLELIMEVESMKRRIECSI
jgi:peptidoglycan hydrolase CwlO-like protein